MNTKRIAYYDLRDEAARKVLPEIIGRSQELSRLGRLLSRRVNNNALVIGNSGSGKTALLWGWMRQAARDARYDAYALLQLDAGHIFELDQDPALEERYAESLMHLPTSVVLIDDFGREINKHADLMRRISRLYREMLCRPGVHVVLTLLPHEHAWLEREFPSFVALFERITLKEVTAFESARILRKKMPALNKKHSVIVPDDCLKDVVSYTTRYPSLGAQPRSAIQLLDESIALSATNEEGVLTNETIAAVVESKTGIPAARTAEDELKCVRDLEANLREHIVAQDRAIAKIAATLRRAKLGLRDPRRPLGSFLLLGPSGVGKTETAKCVAERMFGRSESFVRIDMSEFQQEHSVQRLIGAPPGYVGYDEGGELTNALKRDPHTLVLLDEIEKAHPKVFDLFLQLLDEGRLTSGRGELVDARSAIFMATSNAAVQEILSAHKKGTDTNDETFLREHVLPALASTFRLEFINRFDRILVFQPLSVPSLVAVAQLEIQKIERRLSKHQARFYIEPNVLEREVRGLADARFGARPVKRFVEETCESLLADALIGTTI